jgi:hypothetical protein
MDKFKENDRFTTLPQQLHNTLSHRVGPSVWDTPPCKGYCAVVVVVLCRNQIPTHHTPTGHNQINYTQKIYPILI